MISLSDKLSRLQITTDLEKKRAEWYKSEVELSTKIEGSLTNHAKRDSVQKVVSGLLSQQQERLQLADSRKKIEAVHWRYRNSVAFALAELSEDDLNTLQIGSIVQLTKFYMKFQRVRAELQSQDLSDIVYVFLHWNALELANDAACMLP